MAKDVTLIKEQRMLVLFAVYDLSDGDINTTVSINKIISWLSDAAPEKAMALEEVNRHLGILRADYLLANEPQPIFSMGNKIFKESKLTAMGLKKFENILESAQKKAKENIIAAKNFKIFYSWQSDLANNTNRSFIKDALEKTCKNLNSKFQEIEFNLDHDTRGVPGSPDIFNEICKKISDADVFVADITPIVKIDSKEKKPKEIPNPNVMLELGYALRALGDEKIILLINKAYSKVDNLPFDLGLKRGMSYRCEGNNEEKSQIRSDLSDNLFSAISLIYEAKIVS